jgi:mxaA protein
MLLFMLAMLPASAAMAAPEIALATIEPRGFGFFVGDVFRREIDVTVTEPYRLDKASLPAAGRLTYWLDLRAVSLEESTSSGTHRYRIGLDYQNFYVALAPTRVVVPGVTLKFTDGNDSVDAEVPPLGLVVAAIREIQPEAPEGGPAGYLRPDAVPGLVKTGRARTLLAWSGAGLLLGLLLLAFHNAWWPFRARPSRPFTRAARAIRLRAAQETGLETYRASLIDLHRAFDASAGRRVLSEDVPEFLAGHAAFRPLGGDIAKFFASSRRAFFGNDAQGAADTMPLPSVIELSAKLGAAERRAA